MRRLLLILLVTGIAEKAVSQVGIGTNTPDTTSILHLQSNSKGFLLPRMTKAERNAILKPATGLLVFQTDDTSGFYSNTNTPENPVWKKLDAAAASLPTGSIITSDKFPDTSLMNAGYTIFRVIFQDSSAQYGPYGNWSNMDTANCQYFNLNGSQPPTAVGGGYIYTYGVNNVSPFEPVIVRYNPLTNTWQKLTNLPLGLLPSKDQPTMIWTGTELLIWGGNSATDGYRYNPNTNSWTTMSNSNAPSSRNFYLSCFTGTELVIWGGTDANTAAALNTGARYNLASNTWSVMNIANAPNYLSGATAVLDGNAMYVYGGGYYATYSNKMNKYDLVSNTWTQNTPGGTAVPVRGVANMMSSNGFIFMYGGMYTPQFGVTQFLTDGYVYNTVNNTWSVNIGFGLPGYTGGTNYQRGNKVYIFGGVSGSSGNYNYTNEFGVRDITSGNPAYTKLGNAPIASRLGSRVDTLTGNRLIYWGGYRYATSAQVPFGDGIIYNIGNNTFTDIASEGAPSPGNNMNTRAVSGKFVLWNMGDATNSATYKGYVYTPDLFGFGKPQKLKLYLYQKN